MRSDIRVRMIAGWAAALAVCGLVLAGCSSLGSGTGGTGSSTASASGSSGAADPAVAAAQKSVDQAINPPATIGVTEPLKTAPSRGGSIIYFLCDVVTCKPPGEGIQAATKAIGWSYRALTWQYANPQTLIAAMTQAINYKPTAVVVPSAPIAVWQSMIPKLTAAGIKIVTFGESVATPPSPILGNVAGPISVKEQAADLFNWMIADSKGNKIHALLVTAPDVPTEKLLGDDIKTSLPSCSSCKVTDLDLTTAQLAGSTAATTAVVSSLQKDPSINYILNGYGPQLSGLSGALAAAGLTHQVRVAGYTGGAEEFAGVKAGQYAAYTAWNGTYGGWLATDMILRDQQGISFKPADGEVPSQLFVSGTDFNVNDAVNFQAPAGYPQQFLKLWKVS